jgi:hypothetical protein
LKRCGSYLYLLLIASGSLGFMACDSGDSGVNGDSFTAQLVSTNQDTVTPYHLSLIPGNVSNTTTPTIHGYASAGDQIKLYPSAHCTGGFTATTIADASGIFNLVSPALSAEGLQKFSVLAIHSDLTSNCSASYVTYLLDISAPTVSSFPSNQTVSSVPATLQFGLSDSYSALSDLQANNANGTITVTGCTGGNADLFAQPVATIDNTHKPLFKINLSGGTCNDGDLLQVTLHGEKLRDVLGNTATSSETVTAIYYLALTAPAVTLSRHDGLTNPINSTTSLVADIGFVHATNGATTLVSDSTNAAGKVTLVGAITGCNVNVQMNSGLTGGQLTITGCSANGALSVLINNSLVRNAANVAGTGTTVLDLTVDNTGPNIASALHADADYVPALTGANTLTFLLNDASGVSPLSATNANGEFVVSGSCAVKPSVAISSLDGMSYVATLSGGTCAEGDSVIVSMDPNKIFDIAGNVDNFDTLNDQTIQYSIDVPAAVVTPIGFDSGAVNLVMTFSKILTGGNARLYCGPDSSTLTEVTLPGAFFSTDRSIKWLVSDIIAGNGVNPFTSGNICNMDVSQLVDTHGVRVDGSSGTAVVSSFIVP